MPREDQVNTYHFGTPGRLTLKFRDRTITLGAPYPEDVQHADGSHIGQVSIKVTQPTGFYGRLGHHRQALAYPSIELTIDEDLPK
jgi:hypothetical protein